MNKECEKDIEYLKKFTEYTKNRATEEYQSECKNIQYAKDLEKRAKVFENILNYIENSIPKEKVEKILDKLDKKYEDRTENLETILDEQHFLFNSKDYYEGEITGLQEVKVMLIVLNKELLEGK